MRSLCPLLTPAILLAMTAQAPGDDVHRVPPLPMSTSPAAAPAEEGTSPTAVPVPAAPSQRTYTYQSTVDDFQSSSYWAEPHPFDPSLAPTCSNVLARDGWSHTRYVYFKYRAPWTYQGPAAASHTIEWSRWLQEHAP